MRYIIKENSGMIEYYSSLNEIVNLPIGYIELTTEQHTSLLEARELNPDGSIINGVWVPEPEIVV